MNVEELRTIQRLERNALKLADLPASFYDDLRDLVIGSRAKYESTHSPEDLRALENVVKMSRDVFERREQKLVMKSLRFIRTGEDDAKLSGFEKPVFGSLVSSMRQFHNDFESILVAEAPKAALVQPAGQQAQAPATNGVTETLIRVLKSIPKFVSADMKEYGPFDANAIIKLPKKEAELLLVRQFAEQM